MNDKTADRQKQVFWTGVAATIGAFIVGVGEFTFQYSPRGGYEGQDYLYFLDVSRKRTLPGNRNSF